jgi:hypothetical protein
MRGEDRFASRKTRQIKNLEPHFDPMETEKPLFPLFAEQLAARPMDEMKSAAGRAEHRFVSAMRIARCGLVREPMLHVHAGAGTFEDEVIHAVGQLDDCAVGRLDLCQMPESSPCHRALKAVPCEGRTRH